MVRRILAITVLGALALLTACGKNPNYVPVFTTTPPTTAAEGVLYTYTFDAGTPRYGAYLAKLTKAPAGAALIGTTITWTPTETESCVPDSFELTVWAPGGPSATQSWVITPTCRPRFTSTAPLAAEQGVEYDYTIEATASQGKTVSYALTAKPTGATLTGNVITWTPSAAQSRTANQFTVTATAEGSGSSQQSWTVTPTGTITVGCIDQYWTGSNTSTADKQLLSDLWANVPQTNGSYQKISGTLNADGQTYSIPGVPAGFYDLVLQPTTGFSLIYWTDSSTFDCGTDYAGRKPAPSVNGTMALSLSAMDVWVTGDGTTQGDGLALVAPAANLYCALTGPTAILTDGTSTCDLGSAAPDDGATSLTIASASYTGFSPLTGDDSYLLQYKDGITTSGSRVLRPALEKPLTLNSGSTALSINGALSVPSTLSTIDVIVKGTAWATIYDEQAPTAASAADSFVTLGVQPIVTGRVVANRAPLKVPSLKDPSQASDIPQRPALGLVYFDVDQITTDGTDLKAQVYNNPFPSTGSTAWPVVFSAYGGSIESGVNAMVGFSTTTVPTSAISPMMGPVTSPTLNGLDLFNIPQTAQSQPLTLSWTAPTGLPTGLKLYGYRILISSVAGSTTTPVITMYTTQSSMSLPPLDAGKYVFLIEALADGGLANIKTGPYHWQYPTAYAAVVSGPVTVQ